MTRLWPLRGVSFEARVWSPDSGDGLGEPPACEAGGCVARLVFVCPPVFHMVNRHERVHNMRQSD